MTVDVQPADYDIESLAPGEAVAVDWTSDRYHSDTRTVSRSELDLLISDPETYHDVCVARVRPWPRVRSKAMELGTLVHLAVLEPEEWWRRLAPVSPVKPDGARKGKSGTRPRQLWDMWEAAVKARKAVLAKNPDAIEATPANRRKVETMAARIKAHPFAGALLELEGPTEQTIIWREPTTGVLIRVRPDKMAYLNDGAIAVPDLKSTDNPRPDAFERSIQKYRYHFQAGIYTDAVRALYPDREVIYALVAAQNIEPYKVGAWPMDERAILKGRREYLAALDDLVERGRTGNWLETWENEHDKTIGLPAWAYKDDK